MPVASLSDKEQVKEVLGKKIDFLFTECLPDMLSLFLTDLNQFIQKQISCGVFANARTLTSRELRSLRSDFLALHITFAPYEVALEFKEDFLKILHGIGIEKEFLPY